MQSEQLKMLLRPLIRFWLKRSGKLNELIDITKVLMVEEGARLIAEAAEKPNVSRISVMTGVHRRDVTAIFRENIAPIRQTQPLLMRVMGQWENDRKFTTKNGDPRVLTCDTDESEFHRLVRTVSMNIHPGTVLFELQRIGAVEITKKGARMLQSVHRLHSSGSKGFEILADDMESLITAVDQNIGSRKEIRNLHIRTEYDNILKSKVPQIRRWLTKQGELFHKRARNFLSTHDLDLNPDLKGEGGAKVTLTAFSLTDPTESD